MLNNYLSSAFSRVVLGRVSGGKKKRNLFMFHKINDTYLRNNLGTRRKCVPAEAKRHGQKAPKSTTPLKTPMMSKADWVQAGQRWTLFTFLTARVTSYEKSRATTGARLYCICVPMICDACVHTLYT